LNWAEANREFFHSNVWATLRDDAGRAIFKYPTDLWVYREIIRRTQPVVIVETGSGEGGSAAWFADYAEVISIDIAPPDHPDTRVSWIRGSSLSTDIAEQVYERVRGRHCLVSLDSNHSAEHVAAELQLYAPLVHLGEYLVVEDTAVDEYGLDTEHYPNGGPGVAVRNFLQQGTFGVDERCERFFLGMNPGGWLRRVA
jgi:cephalosporin hydroxylase